MSGKNKKKKLLIQEYAFVKSKSTLTESKDNKGHSIIEGEFGMVDEKNANNRIYPRDIMEREVEIFNKSLGGRGVLGELDHPEDGKTKLIRSSHIIEKLSINEDGKIIGRARIIPTDMGRNLLALYESGAPVGISSRGYGSTVTTDEGVDVVQPDFELKTFDFVEDPSAGVYPELVSESIDSDGKIVIEAISKEDKGEVLKKLKNQKTEAILDNEGEEFEYEKESKNKEKEFDSELEAGTSAEADENKDIEDGQSDTSNDMRSKIDADDEKVESITEGGVEGHIKKGYRTITGKVMSDEEVKLYNSLTDKINGYLKKGKKVPENILNGRFNLFYQSGLGKEKNEGTQSEYQSFLKNKLKDMGHDSIADIPADKKDEFFNMIDKEYTGEKDPKEESVITQKVDNAKAQLNVTLNKITEATEKLKAVKAEKGDSIVLEGIKELLTPLVTEAHFVDKYKTLEERNAELEKNNRELREDNEANSKINRRLTESLDRTVRRLYIEQTLNEIGLHNEDVFFENFNFDSHDTIKSLKEGIASAKKKVKEIHGDNYFSQVELIENTSIMMEKGKDLESEVRELIEQKETLNKSLLFEKRKQVVATELQSKGLLEGYTNKDALIEEIAKKEKTNLLETKKIIKESGVAFQKIPEYNGERREDLKRKLKGFNSDILESELDTPDKMNENINGVNMKDFNTLSGL